MNQLRPRHDADAMDLEQLLATVESPGFARIVARIRDAADSQLRKLAGTATWDETRHAQGVYEGLNIALATPKQLAEEIRRKLKARAQPAE